VTQRDPSYSLTLTRPNCLGEKSTSPLFVCATENLSLQFGQRKVLAAVNKTSAGGIRYRQPGQVMVRPELRNRRAQRNVYCDAAGGLKGQTRKPDAIYAKRLTGDYKRLLS
jgi:hypothetical protein